MKLEITKKDKLSVGIEMNIQSSKKNSVGSFNLQKGEKVFELNLETNEISLAKYRSSSLQFPTQKGAVSNIRKELVLNQNCFYEKAINLQNAKRKFQKRLNIMSKKYEDRIIDFNCKICSAEKSISVKFTSVNSELKYEIKKCSNCENLPTLDKLI